MTENMILKYVVIGMIRATLISSGSTIAATFASQDPNRELTEHETESGFFNEEGYINAGQHTRPPINPDFDPDESCMFDVFQLKYVPGSQQECPEGFGQSEDSTCVPRGDCPEGYHGEDDDETGQCYPDTKPCWPGMIRYPERHSHEGCGDTEYVCEKYNASLPESCFVAGRSIIDFPTTDCLIHPDNDNCAFVEAYGCPPDFTMMTSANFTVPRCVPMNDEEIFEEERERKVFDPNRCAAGYELKVNLDHIQVQTRGDNIGTCNKLD